MDTTLASLFSHVPFPLCGSSRVRVGKRANNFEDRDEEVKNPAGVITGQTVLPLPSIGFKAWVRSKLVKGKVFNWARGRCLDLDKTELPNI